MAKGDRILCKTCEGKGERYRLVNGELKLVMCDKCFGTGSRKSDKPK